MPDTVPVFNAAGTGPREGLEAELYRDYKFQVLVHEEVLNTGEIIRKGFRLDRNFVEKVVNDELIFSRLPQAVKRKNRLRSHKELGKIFPNTQEGRENKRREKELLFDNFIKENSLGSKSSRDDSSMFQDTFELTKKAWKKQGGFSRDDFLRFARNRASDPDLVKIYGDWFETIFSSAAMLCWEAVRLRKNPEVCEYEEPEGKGEKEKPQAPAETGEKVRGIAFPPRIRLAVAGATAILFLSGIFYFMIHILIGGVEEPVKGPRVKPPAGRKEFSQFRGESRAGNPQNSLALPVKKKGSPVKEYAPQKEDRKIWYPVIRRPYEAYLDFRDRVEKDMRVLRECGYRVMAMEGPEADLLAKEKKYQATIDRCAEKGKAQNAGRSYPASLPGGA